METEGSALLEPSARGYFEAVKQSSRTLMDMVTALLDLAKLEAGRMRLDMRDVSLKALVSEIELGVHATMDRNQVRFDVDLPEDLPALRADPDCLRRILVNLLSNAISFSPTGGCVRLTVRRQDGVFHIAVQDEGPGIPPDDAVAIFERFGQAKIRKAGRKYSTGLGLAFCKLAVEAHGGTIAVESEVGKGSTFWFRLPAAS
jgi:signal transduction histidine kinase